MSAHFEKLVIDTLEEIKVDVTEIKEQVTETNKRVDRLENTVFEINERLSTFATKKELKDTERRIMDTLEVHSGILKRLDEDRYAEKHRMDRFEGALNETRVHVGLPAME